MSKSCTACRAEKPLSSFYKQKLGRLGFDSQCKSCRNSWRRDWGKKNRERETENARKWRKANSRRHLGNVLKLKFGLSVEAYEKMFKGQNGCCAICKEMNLDGRRLAVDHNHHTGKIRGLLCNRCNRGLGLMRDSIEILHQAADYLEGVKSVIR